MAFLFLLVSVASYQVIITYGDLTPKGLLSRLSNHILIDLSSNHYLENLVVYPQPTLIVDISFNSSNFYLIDFFSELYMIPYITLTKNGSNKFSKYRFLRFNSIENEAIALIQMINYLKWSSFNVLLSNTNENNEILSIIKSKFSEFQVNSFTYDENSDEEKISLIIKRFIKAKGSQHVVILDQSNTLEICSNTLSLLKVNKFGTYFLFKSLSIFQVNLKGSLLIEEQDIQNSFSLEDFYWNTVISSINQFNGLSLNQIENICNQHICSKSFQIINLQGNLKVSVGKIKEKIVIDKQILFPGGNTQIGIENYNIKIPIMIANETMKGSNPVYPDYILEFYSGSQYALEQVNREKELENFVYELEPTDCGNLYYDVMWYVKCLKKYENSSSIAYISGYFFGSAVGNLVGIRAQNRFLPQISPYGFSDAINNASVFPEFLKMTGTYSEYLLNNIFMYKFYGWLHLIILISDTQSNKILFEELEKAFIQMSLTIINDEKHRIIPANYTRDDFENYRYVFEYIRDTKCATIVFNHPNSGYLAEGLYDVGLRKGDVVIIGGGNLYYSLLEDIDEKYMKKRREILSSAWFGTPTEYEGELGDFLEQDFKRKHNIIMIMCLAYDSFATIANSVKYNIYKGEDYENPEILIKTMRTQRLFQAMNHFLTG